MTSYFSPPTSVSGMKALDKKAFERLFLIPALNIDAIHCSKMRKGFSRILLKQARVKDVMPDPIDKLKRNLLLNLSVKGIDDFTDKEKKLMNETNAELISYELVCTYDHFTADQILNAVLPNGMEVTTSFETIGHIAHLNLKECQLPYKRLIGQVILDKNPSIKTVVNKTNSIEETFRFFHMELIAGEDRMFASLKQHDCRFEFDFSKVYWNSRLQTEHQRIVDLLKPVDTVYDVFAGVGPFAIPAAKKGCKVYANDLNPESIKALKHNAKINKVEKNIVAFNMDGRDFLRQFFKHTSNYNANPKNVEQNLDENLSVTHILMNLPAIAVEFLDVFRDLTHNECLTFIGEPSKSVFIHCYCFTKSEDPCKDAMKKVEDIMDIKIPNAKVHYVRNVAPKKAMMCITFQLNCHFQASKEFVCQDTTLNQNEGNTEKRGTKRSVDELS